MWSTPYAIWSRSGHDAGDCSASELERRRLRPSVHESVLALRRAEIEIVVIDNHSTDGSADVIEHLLGPSRVHHNVVRVAENRGICGGLQVAFDRQLVSTTLPSSRPTTRCCPTGCNGSVVARRCRAPHTHRGRRCRTDRTGRKSTHRWSRRPLVRCAHRGIGGLTLRRSTRFSLKVPPAPGLVFRTAGLRSIGGYDTSAPVEDIDTYRRIVLLGGQGGDNQQGGVALQASRVERLEPARRDGGGP